MKKEKIAVLILSILIVLSVGNILILRKEVGVMQKELISLISESGDEAAYGELWETWERMCPYFQTVLRHDTTDKIQEKLLRLSEVQNSTEATILIRNLQYDLEQLIRKELPTIPNIL